MKKEKIKSIGIDLVRLDRMKLFVERSGLKQVQKKIFSEDELNSIEDFSFENIARIFSAKEAMFKACNEKWLGFSQMTVHFKENDCFEISWERREDYKVLGQGEYFKVPGHLGAKVIVF